MSRKRKNKSEPDYTYEKKYWSSGFRYIAGVDEAGRGALAGPVVAAAVILNEDIQIPKLNDSKQLTSIVRSELYNKIKNEAISWGIGIIDNTEIDKINILNATHKAMKNAIKKLNPHPQLILVDGWSVPKLNFFQKGIIKGDSISLSIAAASIIAKVYRDQLMIDYDQEFSGYGFSQNKGYGTKKHRHAIKKTGICEIHRKSFSPIKEIRALKLF